MVCSLSLYIQFHKQKLRHSFRIFCPSAVPFFLVVYYLLIHNFSYSIADMIHLVHINGMYPAFSNQLHNRFNVSCPESLVYHFCDPTAPAILAGAFFIRFRCCRRLWLPDPGGLLCVLPGSGPLSKAGKRPGFSVYLNTSFPRCGS